MSQKLQFSLLLLIQLISLFYKNLTGAEASFGVETLLDLPLVFVKMSTEVDDIIVVDADALPPFALGFKYPDKVLCLAREDEAGKDNLFTAPRMTGDPGRDKGLSAKMRGVPGLVGVDDVVLRVLSVTMVLVVEPRDLSPQTLHFNVSLNFVPARQYHMKLVEELIVKNKLDTWAKYANLSQDITESRM